MTPSYQLLALTRDDPRSLAYLPVVLARIEAMSHRLGGNAILLKNQVWELYAKNSPVLGLWAALDHETVVGHALAQIQGWDGRLVGWVNQVEMDTAAGTALKDTFLIALENWVHMVNASLKQSNQDLIHELIMVTRRASDHGHDHWSRHAGFDPYLYLYRREVKGV